MKFNLSENPLVAKEALRLQYELLGQCRAYLDPSIVIPIGGDGTFIQALHKFGLAPTYFPLGIGSQNYLMNSVDPLLRRDIVHGNYYVQGLSVLQVGKQFAFNEVAFQSVGGQASHLLVKVNGHPVTNEPLVGSGLIVYTPQGSTGWAYSAGVTCLEPSAPRLIGITAINPYRPRLPSFVVPSTSKITVEILDLQNRPVAKYIDGIPTAVEPFTEITGALDEAKVMYRNCHDFTARLLEKIVR